MHILYLHQHFALPKGSTGTRSYELGRRWVEAGHQVTLICGITDQSGIDAEGRKLIEIDAKGIRVIALNMKYSNSLSFCGRVWTFIKFVLCSFWVGLKINNVDVIYATSTPLTIGIPAVLLKWCRRVPFVFEVRDQWPRIPIEMGIIKNPTLKWFLYRLERRFYKSAVAIVALSPGMAEGIQRVLKSVQREIIIAPNSADTKLFHPDIDASEMRDKLGWKGKFIVLHFGAMGKVNSLHFLIDVAKSIQQYQDIHIVLVGEGKERKTLADKAASLKNFEVKGPVSKNKLPEIVAACDIATVIIGNYPVIQDNSSNKFFDSLSAGKPVLLNYSGWQREIIENHKCGYGCKLYDTDEYIKKLLYLYEKRGQLPEMGRNARRLAKTEYDRDLISNRILTLVEKVYQNLK